MCRMKCACRCVECVHWKDAARVRVHTDGLSGCRPLCSCQIHWLKTKTRFSEWFNSDLHSKQGKN